MKIQEIIELSVETKKEGHVYPHFLQKLVKHFDMDVALECGTGGGGSCMKLATGNDHIQVITIDWKLNPNTREHLNKHYPNIVTIIGNTLEVEDAVKNILNGRTIDLLFIDSTHDGTTPRKEFDIYSKYLSDEALLVADDVSLSKPMEEFWASMPGEKAYFLYLHPTSHAGFGVSIIRKPDE